MSTAAQDWFSSIPLRSSRFRKRVECADGFAISVQASEGHYCSPRNDVGPYNLVELGFPSEVEPDLAEYAEDSNCLTETIYPYTPIEVIYEVILKHGGMV